MLQDRGYALSQQPIFDNKHRLAQYAAKQRETVEPIVPHALRNERVLELRLYLLIVFGV
jgi:hypothetical protein